VTASPFERRNTITIDDYLAFDEAIRRDIEIVDGIAFPREQRSRGHQKAGFRFAEALESAVAKARRDHGDGAPCIEVNTEIEVVLWEVPLNIRKPDVVVHRCVDEAEWVEGQDVLIAIEVLSKYSERRDRIHKMGEYARAGILHYWIAQLDDVGVLAIEHYALIDDSREYARIGITHRDRDQPALKLTSPFGISIDWSELEITPRS
jgi:Uma2 family endonuclease